MAYCTNCRSELGKGADCPFCQLAAALEREKALREALVWLKGDADRAWAFVHRQQHVLDCAKIVLESHLRSSENFVKHIAEERDKWPNPEGLQQECPHCGRDIGVDLILCPYCLQYIEQSSADAAALAGGEG